MAVDVKYFFAFEFTYIVPLSRATSIILSRVDRYVDGVRWTALWSNHSGSIFRSKSEIRFELYQLGDAVVGCWSPVRVAPLFVFLLTVSDVVLRFSHNGASVGGGLFFGTLFIILL